MYPDDPPRSSSWALALLIAAVIAFCAIGGCAQASARSLAGQEIATTSSAPARGVTTGYPPAGSAAAGAELSAVHNDFAADDRPQAKSRRPPAQAAITGQLGAYLSPAGSGSRATTRTLRSRQTGPAGDALTLARAAWLETGLSVPDAKALVGVMRSRARRAGSSLAAAAYSYTAIGRGFGAARNDLGRSLPDGPVPTWSPRANARWAALRAAVRAVLDGRARTPCPGADHLGSSTLQPDRRRAERAIRDGRWRRVDCGEPVVHAYYAIVERP